MIAVYPGSFDPCTNGHIDIIKRVGKIADKLYVAILANSKKTAFFSVDERLAHLKHICYSMQHVEVIVYSGLLVDLAIQLDANTIIRGLRSTMDFEYELQMAFANKKMADEVETFFIPTSFEYTYLSSSIVKEIASYGGNTSHMVPDIIKEALLNKMKLIGNCEKQKKTKKGK